MGMSISLKKDTRKTNIRHNNRELSEKDKVTNTHIDWSKSDENVLLVKKDIRQVYADEFGEAQEKYNDKQKRNDRKIADYYKHIQKGKKTSPQQEMIIQIGDKDDFANNDKNRQMTGKVLEEWFEDFEKRNPQLKVYNAVIHQDEASPHMHLNFVPVATGYKRGLEKQVSFDRAITQQDPELDKTRPFDDWREKEVAFLEKRLAMEGIAREKVGTNTYEDVTEYKEKQRELESINKELERQREALRDVQAYAGSLHDAEQGKKEKRSMGFVGAEMVELPKESYEKLRGMASEGYHANREAGKARMKNAKLKEELAHKKKANETLQTSLHESRQREKSLKEELKVIRSLYHTFRIELDLKLKEKRKEVENILGCAKAMVKDAFGKSLPELKPASDDEERGMKKYDGDFEPEQKIKKKSKNQDRGMEM